MEDLNALSNDELRYRLTQFGFPNLPVTSTTRKVLIKKLRNHMDNEKAKLRRDTSYATRYSSDEDEDRTSKRRATSRQTIATSAPSGIRSRASTAMPPPSSPPTSSSPAAAKLSTTSNSWGSKLSQQRFNVQKKTNSVYVSPLIQSHDGDDTEEDSDSNASGHASFSSRNSRGTNVSPRASLNGTSSSFYNGSDAGRDASYGPGGRSLGVYNNSDVGYGSENRFSSASSSLRNRNYGSPPDESDGGSRASLNGSGSDENASYHSTDFTKRLLSLRSKNIGSASINSEAGKRFDRFVPSLGLRTPHYLNDSKFSPNMTRDSISVVYQAESPSYHQSKRLSMQPLKRAAPAPAFSLTQSFKNFVHKLDDQYGVKQTLVPCTLLTTLFIFFALVIVSYMTISPNLSASLDTKATNYQLCPSDVHFTAYPQTEPAVTCIEQSDLDSAIQLLKLIIPELQKRIEFNRCVDPSASFAMSARAIVHFVLQLRPHSHVMDHIRALNNAEYLISINPQWRVGQFADASCTTPITIGEVKELRPSQSNFFAIVNPRLPLTCFLYHKLHTFFKIIGWIAVIVVAAYLLVFAFKFVRGVLKARRDRLNNMIDCIINGLMEKAYDPDTASTDEAIVVINHMRDTLIPASERSKMEPVWNAAIKFIEQNESRVEFSIATRNGEDYRVMRWIDTSTPLQRNIMASNSESNSTIPRNSTAGAMTVKKWQSPAFDKTNKIKDPPTECLKIRQMFDKYEANNAALEQIIKDAILEKLASTTCKVYDIQLDKQTCCVYVRCASAKDAGMVHDEINGWWFDSRLVSIKFLRLDRYLSRFPDAAAGPHSLKPSNSDNLSMT